MGLTILWIVLVTLALREVKKRHDLWERSQPQVNYPYNWVNDSELYWAYRTEEEHGNPSLEIS